ncbi:MAG: PorT family protein [Muribaculaceae bacterium]|nr:PorT family protein [Muribaculaceae bacterium]
MKKLLVTLLIAVMGVGVADAQFRFGVKAGLNVNHLSTNTQDILDKNNQAGFTAGVMTEFEVPIVGLCFDLSLMYTRMNSNVFSDDEEQTIDNKNFIEIPLNLKYKFKLPVVSSFLSPYIFTGPSFGFNLDKHTYDYFKTKTFQSVWNVGLGLELIKHLQIGASYGFGMNNIVKMIEPDVEPVKLHNNYWTVTAAWLF